MNNKIIQALVATLALNAFDACAAIDLKLVATIFKHYQQDCREYQKLWNKSLCGNTLVVDGKTRQVVANTKAATLSLDEANQVYTGQWPEDGVFSNTAIEWQGRVWAMVVWPLPENEADYLALLRHEHFHRVQDDIYDDKPGGNNRHMAEADARVWQIMEWRALRQSLIDLEQNRLKHFQHALLFAKARHQLSFDAMKDEEGLMLNEGMASYTGDIHLLAQDAKEYSKQLLNSGQSLQNFSRSFAYYSGPLWGSAADPLLPGWREKLIETGDFWAVMMSLGDKLPEGSVLNKNAVAAAKAYGYDEVYAKEQQRAVKQAKMKAAVEAKLSPDSRFEIPLYDHYRTFNPQKVFSINGLYTAYDTITVTDNWGKLTVEGIAIFRNDRAHIAVTEVKSIDGNMVYGEDWQLKLADGWLMDKQQGRWVLKQTRK